jgi:hypothetical protein
VLALVLGEEEEEEEKRRRGIMQSRSPLNTNRRMTQTNIPRMLAPN